MGDFRSRSVHPHQFNRTSATRLEGGEVVLFHRAEGPSCVGGNGEGMCPPFPFSSNCSFPHWRSPTGQVVRSSTLPSEIAWSGVGFRSPSGTKEGSRVKRMAEIRFPFKASAIWSWWLPFPRVRRSSLFPRTIDGAREWRKKVDRELPPCRPSHPRLPVGLAGRPETRNQTLWLPGVLI